MSTKKLSLLLVTSMLTIFTVLYLGPLSDVWPQAKEEKTLRIGELAGLTGGIAALGTQLHNARLLAIEEINNKGGVLIGNTRYKIEMAHLDAGPPAEAIKVFERLLTVEKLKLILDGAYSSVEYALAPVIKGKDVLVLWSGGPDPGTTVGVPNAFRNHFDGGGPYIKVNELFLKKLGAKRISTYGQVGHADFTRAVKEILPKVPGFEVVSTDWYPFGEKDFFPVLKKIKDLKPDAVITHGFVTDALNMVKQARDIGLLPGPIWVNQLGSAPQMMDEASTKIFEGTYESFNASLAVTTEMPDKSKKFVDAYIKKFGERVFGPWAEPGYDGVYILAKALQKAATVDDIPKIIKALHDLTTDDIPELLLPYKPGKIFDSEGQAYPKIIVVQWKEGKMVPVFSDYGM